MQQPSSVTWRVVDVLRRALARAEELDAAALAELDLTAREYGVLALLQNGPRARQHEVGAALGLDRTTTAALMRTLAGRGLVHRAPMPGSTRTLVLRLTPEGERLRALAEHLLHLSQDALLSRLSTVERERLRSALLRLVGGSRT